MIKKVILVRHGESETNLSKAFTGQLNAPLTEIGREQARLMARYLDKYALDKIYVSPLQRAVDTAQAIVQRQNCPVEQDRRIMEINAGLWQGLTFTEIAENYPHTYEVWKSDIGNAAPEEGETCRELYNRVTEFFKELLKAPEETICLVCHATPIRMIESYIHAGSAAAAQEISWVPNASVTVYENDGVFHEVERGSCDYLGQLRTNLPKSI